MSTTTSKLNDVVIPRITLPPFVPPTPEEIARRREVVARMRALRDEIGPIGISTSELIRQVREELDGDDV